MNFPRFSLVPAASQDADVILEALKNSPAVAKAVEDNAARKRAERQELVSRLAKLESSAMSKFNALDVALDTAMREFKAAQLKLAEASDRMVTARNRKSTASFAFSNEHDQLEGALRESCSPEVGLFIREMWDEWERTRHLSPEVSVDVVVNKLTGGKSQVMTGEGNRSILARMAAIREAIAAAEGLQFEADQANVSALLHDLRQNLPKA